MILLLILRRTEDLKKRKPEKMKICYLKQYLSALISITFSIAIIFSYSELSSLNISSLIYKQMKIPTSIAFQNLFYCIGYFINKNCYIFLFPPRFCKIRTHRSRKPSNLINERIFFNGRKFLCNLKNFHC